MIKRMWLQVRQNFRYSGQVLFVLRNRRLDDQQSGSSRDDRRCGSELGKPAVIVTPSLRTGQTRTPKMPNATAAIGSKTRLRDGSNRVLAMITKGSMTGSLISANQLPPMTRGVSNEPTTIA